MFKTLAHYALGINRNLRSFGILLCNREEIALAMGELPISYAVILGSVRESSQAAWLCALTPADTIAAGAARSLEAGGKSLVCARGDCRRRRMGPGRGIPWIEEPKVVLWGEGGGTPAGIPAP